MGSTKLDISLESSRKAYAALEVKTPFEGYRKMNFIMNLDITKNIVMNLTAEIPMHETATKVTLQLPNTTYGFDFKFADEQYSKMALLKFLNNGTPYGGGLKLRYKAPYVLDADV